MVLTVQVKDSCKVLYFDKTSNNKIVAISARAELELAPC